MKRFIFLALSLILLFPTLVSCSSLSVEETATEAGATVTEETESGAAPYLDINPYYPVNLTREQLNTLPIAVDEMTPAQRRMLALNYFELQLTFRWRSNMDIDDYPTTYSKKPKSLEQKYIYSGIPYQSGGTGNLYRWLEYYDEATGMMDLARALEENGGYGEDGAVTGVQLNENGDVTYKKYRSFMALFNQCSVASSWGWGRVVNSASLGWTYDMNVRNGFIPVGSYTYPDMQKIDCFGEKTDANPTGFDTKDVIAHVLSEKGINGMNECYAKMKPGDCIVSGGHAMMIKSVSMVYKADGTPDWSRCTAIAIDQGEGWATDSELEGVPYRRQGSVDTVYLFSYFQKNNYLPFTFREFLEESDPIDKEHIAFYDAYIKNNRGYLAEAYPDFNFSSTELEEMTGERVEKATVWSSVLQKSENLSASQLEEVVVASNYPISDVFVTVKDKDGKELLKNTYRAGSPRIRQVKMTAKECSWKNDETGNPLTLSNGIAALAEGENRIEITLQLSTGELLTALSRTLIP